MAPMRKCNDSFVDLSVNGQLDYYINKGPDFHLKTDTDFICLWKIYSGVVENQDPSLSYIPRGGGIKLRSRN